MYPFDEEKKETNPFICEVFGSHQKDEKNMETGKCRFLAAYLLSFASKEVTPSRILWLLRLML